MPHRQLRILFLILLGVCPVLVTAQSPEEDGVRLGPQIFLGAIGQQSGSFPVYFGDVCGEFSDGRPFEFGAGAIATYRRSKWGSYGIDLRLGYRRLTSRYTSRPGVRQLILDASTGDVIELDREFRFDATTDYVDLDLRLAWSPMSPFRLSAGATLSAAIGGLFEQTDNILGPQNRAFSDGESIHIMPFGIAVSRAPVTAGIVFTAGTDIRLDKRRSIVPELRIRTDITSLVREEAWRSISAGVGIGFLLFDIAPWHDTVVVVPPPPRIPASPSVAIIAEGVDEQGNPSPTATISVKEVLLQTYTPLVPAVFFDSGRTEAPNRYTRLSVNQATEFSEYDIAELDPYALAHRVADVVGLRMRRDPEARLHLYASTSLDEPLSIGSMRAKWVRDYLTGIWGIDGRRVEIRTTLPPVTLPPQTTPDGLAENRAVIFGSNSPFLLEPLVTERLLREFNPPRVQLVPSIDAPAGVAQWQVSISNHGNEIASFSGNGAVTPNGDSLEWRLDGRQVDSSLGLLIATISVTDSLGRIASAHDTVALRLRKESAIARASTERIGEIERRVIELAGFDYRSAAGGKTHLSSLRAIASSIRPDAVIEVTGYTDRIGDDEANLSLSRERASWVAERLSQELAGLSIQSVRIRTTGAGLVTDRFSNDTPEGRILSRGARLVIEQKIE